MSSDLRAAQAAAEQRVRCLETNDRTGLATLLDDALIYVHSPGQVHDKVQLLQFLTEELRVLKIERRPLMQIAQDGLALLVFEQRMRAERLRAGHAVIEARSHFSEVWRLVDGHWRLLHAQSTAPATPPAG